jgi:hypothetical protein
MTPLAALADPRSRRIAVWAHPDDETLWAGGLLLRHPGDWTVLCCSIPYRDPIRAFRFFDACEALGARGRLLPFCEERNAPLDHLEEHLPELSTYGLIVTHGPSGEYGHPAHRQVHAMLAPRYPGRLLCSAYGAPDDATLVVALSSAESGRKETALDCYRHDALEWRADADLRCAGHRVRRQVRPRAGALHCAVSYFALWKNRVQRPLRALSSGLSLHHL